MVTRSDMKGHFKALFKNEKFVAMSTIAASLGLGPRDSIPSLLQEWNLSKYFDVHQMNVLRNDKIMPWERVKDGLKRAGKWALKNSIPVAISLATGGLGLTTAVAPLVSQVVSFFRGKGLEISGDATQQIGESITSGSENILSLLQERIQQDNRNKKGANGVSLSPESVSCLVQMSMGEVMPSIIEEINAVLNTFSDQMTTDFRDVFDGWLDEQRDILARDREKDAIERESERERLEEHAQHLDALEEALGDQLASIKLSVAAIHENVLVATNRLDGIENAIGRLFEVLCQRSLGDFSMEELVQASTVQFERTRLASKHDIPFDPALFVPLPRFDMAFISFLNQRGILKPLFLVLAHMGMGKTWNAVHAGTIARDTRRFVPFFIPFNMGWQSQLCAIFGTKTALANDVGSTAKNVYQKHGRAVKILLIFDGLDELLGEEQKSEFLSFLLQLFNGFGHTVMVVLTCRDTTWILNHAIDVWEQQVRVHAHDNIMIQETTNRLGLRTPVGFYLESFPRELLAGNDGLLAKYGVDWKRVHALPALLDLCGRPYMARLLRGLNNYPDPTDGEAFLPVFYSDTPDDTVMRRMGITKEVEKLFFDLLGLISNNNEYISERQIDEVTIHRRDEWHVILSAGIIESIRRGPYYFYRVEPAFHPVVIAMKKWIEGYVPSTGVVEIQPSQQYIGGASAGDQRKKFDFHVQLGNNALATGDFTEAREHFQAALSEANAKFEASWVTEARRLIIDVDQASAREKAEREALEKAEREALEKAEREAREKAEREAREKAEREAREKAEREAREKAEREARENDARENAETIKKMSETMKKTTETLKRQIDELTPEDIMKLTEESEQAIMSLEDEALEDEVVKNIEEAVSIINDEQTRVKKNKIFHGTKKDQKKASTNRDSSIQDEIAKLKRELSVDDQSETPLTSTQTFLPKSGEVRWINDVNDANKAWIAKFITKKFSGANEDDVHLFFKAMVDFERLNNDFKELIEETTAGYGEVTLTYKVRGSNMGIVTIVKKDGSKIGIFAGDADSIERRNKWKNVCHIEMVPEAMTKMMNGDPNMDNYFFKGELTVKGPIKLAVINREWIVRFYERNGFDL